MTVLDLIARRGQLQARIAQERDPRLRAALALQLQGVNRRLAIVHAVLERQRAQRQQIERAR